MFAESWPTWIVLTMVVLLCILIFVEFVCQDKESEKGIPEASCVKFKAFQREYLLVYYLVMFADWLQGTNMYTLYQGYGMNVGSLFLTGFLSSAFFGVCIGPMIDGWGRQRSCLIFCLLEIVINTLEHIPDFYVLFLGRILGGISTSLLFAAFESWMVAEHRKRGFPDDLMASTYSKASVGNGLLAVLAGIVSQIMYDLLGDIGPFQLAIAITVLATFKVSQWPENYGEAHESKSKNVTTINPLKSALQSLSDTRACFVGVGNSLFEGSMYVFVFMWVPTLQILLEQETLPTGLVFSAFMLSLTIGGRLFALIHGRLSDEAVAVWISLLATSSMAVPWLFDSFYPVFAAFIMFEMMVGAFTPCSATLRSKYIRNEVMGVALTTSRFFLNAIVVIGTKLADYVAPYHVFQYCCTILFVASICHTGLLKKNKQQ